MSKEPQTYRRLPGKGATATAYHRLYQGPDHLLQVSSTGYSESYKRFYFRDIQAVIVQRTSLGKVLNWVFGGLTVLCLVFWGLVVSESVAYGFGEGIGSGYGVLAVLFTPVSIIPCIVNFVLGPTCECIVRTAVQVERLPTLRRVRRAEKVLDQIKALIEAEQGQLAPEELERQQAASLNLGTVYRGDAPPVVVSPDAGLPGVPSMAPASPAVNEAPNPAPVNAPPFMAEQAGGVAPAPPSDTAPGQS